MVRKDGLHRILPENEYKNLPIADFLAILVHPVYFNRCKNVAHHLCRLSGVVPLHIHLVTAGAALEL